MGSSLDLSPECGANQSRAFCIIMQTNKENNKMHRWKHDLGSHRLSFLCVNPSLPPRYGLKMLFKFLIQYFSSKLAFVIVYLESRSFALVKTQTLTPKNLLGGT